MNKLILFLFVLAAFVGLSQILFFLQRKYIELLLKLGGKYLLYIPASFAVPIHELSHLTIAICCRHKIEQYSFFQANGTGTLGFVNHTYQPSLLSPFANMLIGLAPLAGGIAAVFVVMIISGVKVPDLSNLSLITLAPGLQAIDFISLFIDLYKLNAEDWVFWVAVVTCVNIVVFAVPSKQDFIGARAGILCTIVVLSIGVLLNAKLSEFIVNSLVQILFPLLIATSVSMMLMNTILYLLCRIIGVIRGR